MDMDPIINGGIAFAAVLILMVLNIPIGIAMLLVGFTGSVSYTHLTLPTILLV